jgi:glycopeptide antibiotics resistance protein
VFQIQTHDKNNGSSRNSKLKHLLVYSFILYLGLVIYVTLFAWNYGASLGPVGPGGRNYNLIPLRSIYRIAVFSPTLFDPIKILIGNIVLFIPFGFLAPIAIKKLRNSLFKTTLLAMFLSIIIELSQFLFTYRVSNIDDVILNTLGAFIGAILIKIIFFIKSKIYVFNI